MISGEFGRRLVDLREGAVTGPARAEATRALVNIVGVAIGAARSECVEIVLAAARDQGTAALVPVPGRPERVDALNAAIAIGAAAHRDDFDDTHLATIVHPAGSVLAAAVPVAATGATTGPRLLTAFALGIETQLRFALAMTPAHYDAGWHITGTVGALGAAVTAGLLLGLSGDELGHALAIASSLTLGHREGFGTMAKPFHVGKAAANGLLAARLAASGCTASESAFEGPYGYFTTLATAWTPEPIWDRLGQTWHLLDNTYKPYPCGIVSHPAIEAAQRLHPARPGREPVQVRVHCHPLVVELTANPDPGDELSAKFSTIHGVAAALRDGWVGLDHYEAAHVHRADIAALRRRTVLVPDDTLERDAAQVELRFADGTSEVAHVTHVRGSAARPLTDDELDDKASRLVERALPGRGGSVVALTRAIDDVLDCREFLAGLAAAPDG